MTSEAQNALDNHRKSYYSVCGKTYERITECYKDPRQTNEETDACANAQRKLIDGLQKTLTGQLMQKCQWLEKCTDTCNGVQDMKCIN